MKAIQVVFSALTIVLIVVTTSFGEFSERSQVYLSGLKDTTNLETAKRKKDVSSVLVIKLWTTGKGQPSISYDNQEDVSGTIPLQNADAEDPDCAFIGDGISKFLVVAYYSPSDASYYAEYFEWNGSALVPVGSPVVLMSRVKHTEYLKVEGNYSGEFSIVMDPETSPKNMENNVTGNIDPLTGLPTIIMAPRVNYLINLNYE